MRSFNNRAVFEVLSAVSKMVVINSEIIVLTKHKKYLPINLLSRTILEWASIKKTSHNNACSIACVYIQIFFEVHVKGKHNKKLNKLKKTFLFDYWWPKWSSMFTVQGHTQTKIFQVENIWTQLINKNNSKFSSDSTTTHHSLPLFRAYQSTCHRSSPDMTLWQRNIDHFCKFWTVEFHRTWRYFEHFVHFDFVGH